MVEESEMQKPPEDEFSGLFYEEEMEKYVPIRMEEVNDPELQTIRPEIQSKLKMFEQYLA